MSIDKCAEEALNRWWERLNWYEKLLVAIFPNAGIGALLEEVSEAICQYHTDRMKARRDGKA